MTGESGGSGGSGGGGGRVESVETLVVGAGIAGLAYAHARGPAADLLVLEAGDRAGGLVRTGHGDAPGPAPGGAPGGAQAGASGLAPGVPSPRPLRFEWGPEALADNAPETRALLGELGLVATPAPAAAGRRWVLWRGRLREVPDGPKALLASGLLSPAGKLRALSEPLRDRDTALDGSVADFVRHRLGPEVLQRLVDPFVTGIYAGDAEQLSLRAAFPLLHELVATHGSLMKGLKARAAAARAEGRPRGVPTLLGVRGGLGELPAALARALGGRLRLRCRVTAIARRAEGSGWRVDAGPAASFHARRLVIAAPAAAAGRMLLDASPALGGALAEVRSESVVSISHAWRRQDVAHPLDGFGYLVPSAERRMHLGTLFSSSIQPECCPEGLVLLRTLAGGAHQGRLVDWPDEELLALVKQDVGPILGLAGEPVFTSLLRHRDALPRYDLRHPARQERIETLLGATPGLSLLGNHRRGIACNALIEVSRKLAREHGAG